MIQMDFGFLSTKDAAGSYITILTAIDVRTQMATAFVTPSKKLNRYGIVELQRFIYELGRSTAIIQTDDEASIKVWSRALCREVPGLQKCTAPT